MGNAVSDIIRNLDLMFENSNVRIVANRSCPEMELAGLKVGPFEEGNEYEIQYWICQDLVKSGIARPREEHLLDATKLYKIQWKERVQKSRQIAKLPDDFYPKLRRFAGELKEQITKNPEKIRDYERVSKLAQDIINSRLKRVVSLSSAPAQTEQVLKNFTAEERFLYERIYRLVAEWRKEIIECGKGEI